MTLATCRRGHSYQRGVGGCRECSRLRGQKWKTRNRKKISDGERAKRAADPEAARAKWNAWRLANLEAHRATVREYRARNGARLKETERAWREANRERDRETKRAWAARNAEKKRAYSIAYGSKNREKQKAWREAHREEQREYHRELYRSEPEKIKAAARAWRAANPDKKRQADRRRKALLRGAAAPGVSVKEWDRICGNYTDADGNVACAYCKKPTAVTVDHLLPVSRGGMDEPENVLPACGSCNSSKHNRLIHEWHRAHILLTEAEIGELRERTERLMKKRAA